MFHDEFVLVLVSWNKRAEVKYFYRVLRSGGSWLRNVSVHVQYHLFSSTCRGRVRNWLRVCSSCVNLVMSMESILIRLEGVSKASAQIYSVLVRTSLLEHFMQHHIMVSSNRKATPPAAIWLFIKNFGFNRFAKRKTGADQGEMSRWNS